MLRLIDADKLRKDILDLPNCYNGYSDTYDKACIIDMIDEQPTVDIDAITETHEKIGYDKGFRDGYATSEVRHGRWILSEDRYWKTCPECGAEVDVSMGLGIFVDDIEVDEMNYCPNCGAKMDEVKE